MTPILKNNSFYFSKLHIQFFRGFQQLNIELTNDFILLYGDNGSGKTNFLEAIHMLCLTKSFKPIADKDLVHNHQDFFFLQAEIKHHSLFNNISCNFLKNKGKKVFHENQPVNKFSEHIGLLPCVSLVPEDNEIIKDSTKRKKWLNLLFSQWDTEYLNALQKYEHALQQRNILLKSDKSIKELEPWTYQLCTYGKILVNKRKAYFERFLTIYTSIQSQLHLHEFSQCIYQPNYEYQSIQEDLSFYEKNLKMDFQYGFTTVGAHKDDIIFLLENQNLKNFGSQGQQKTFIITLKLTEYEFLTQNSKVPILLLDDVFEKLDNQRIRSIANFLFSNRKGQIFVTHPQNLFLDFQPLTFLVKNHSIQLVS